MSCYELTFILRSDLTPQEVETLTAEMASIAKREGATMVKQENWGLRKLAYPINKSPKGHYMFFGLEAEPAALTELERNMRINEDIIRQLTVKVDSIEEEPSAPIREEDEREYDAA